jgi:N-acetylglucosaminyl-diphospho-decaprenol L-rhamnosyltransferase
LAGSSKRDTVLSVIVINHNTRKLTAALVASLYRHVRAVPMEICIVDNNSRDGSAKFLGERHPEIDLVESRVNLGFGRAVNLAVKRCTGRYIWLVNSDCLVGSDVAAGMIEYLERHLDVAAVTSRLVSRDGSFQASCRRLPTFSNVLFSRQSPLSGLLPARADYTLPDFDVPTRVDACACSSTMIRKEHFEKAGGFDPRFFMYCEDTDLCARFAALGLKVVYLPDAEVTHLWAGSWKRNSWMRYYHHHRSIAKYFRKHFPAHTVKLGLLELILVLGLGIRILLLPIRRRT